MTEHTEPGAGGPGPARRGLPATRYEALTTHQMRTVGQRRADAEEKLGRHLRAAHAPTKGHPPTAKQSLDP